jgi:4-amino-4-deoxy-L-arabinose transferase-like glycosyltransferase
MLELTAEENNQRANVFSRNEALYRGCGRNLTSREKRFAAWLFVGVFASRAFTSSSAYFADANRHLTAIRNHTYVIQPPGYWLFNRVAGLFHDPEITISVMNWLFSAAGVTVFYLVTRRIASESVARISSVAYGAVFFSWLSGNIHSTYASQLLFPVAVFLCFLLYWESPKFGWLMAAGALFAVGTGFRPSDGAFFVPAFLYALSRCRLKHAIGCLAIVFFLCLVWLIPQQIALSKNTDPLESNLGSHFSQMADGVLMTGFSPYALSNVIRLVLPLILALFPLLTLIFGNLKQVFLWVWILPGMAFFLFFYFPEAPYLGYMLAALIILAVTNPTASNRRKVWLLAACAAMNVVFYLAWRPVRCQNHKLQVAEYVIEADVGKFSFYAVRHHYDPRLSSLLHVRGWGDTSARP